jgi:hypothetical protein
MEVRLDDKYKKDQRREFDIAREWENDHEDACRGGHIVGVNPNDKDDWGYPFPQYIREKAEKHFRSPENSARETLGSQQIPSGTSLFSSSFRSSLSQGSGPGPSPLNGEGMTNGPPKDRPAAS